MFSWICPQCGRDVPPSKTDCPFCAERAKEAAPAQAADRRLAASQPRHGNNPRRDTAVLRPLPLGKPRSNKCHNTHHPRRLNSLRSMQQCPNTRLHKRRPNTRRKLHTLLRRHLRSMPNRRNTRRRRLQEHGRRTRLRLDPAHPRGWLPLGSPPFCCSSAAAFTTSCCATPSTAPRPRKRAAEIPSNAAKQNVT